MDTEIDEALMELLKLKNYNYIGIDVRIRDGKSTEFFVASREDLLPENNSDDDISRLKEKLELLKKIDELLEKLKKYDEDTDYVPYYPFYPWPDPRPLRHRYDIITTNDNARIKIRWSSTDTADSDGYPLW